MDMGLFRGLITVLTLAAFLGVCWWAYRPGNRNRFERDALMAFEDGEIPGMDASAEIKGVEEAK